MNRQADDPGFTERLADFTATLDARTLPEDVRYVARQCLLDWLGVTLGGHREPLVRILRDDALAAGGRAQATLVGWGDAVTLDQAALVNGSASHALDFDDVQRAMMGHPTVPVAPAVLALAERHHLSGSEVITAFVAGFEAECRVGLLLGPTHYAVGFHATATVGAIGAAAACARLLGLSPDQTRHALGIAATQAAGLKSMFGTMCKPLHAGRAAVTGLTAARWASAGFISNPEAIEVAQGFAATHSAAAPAGSVLDDLGEDWAIRKVLFKYHAACFGTHPGIEAILRLRDTKGLRAEDVTAVTLMVPPAALGMCNIQEPTTGLEGKFSLRFTAALALAGPGTTDASFTDETVRDRRLVAVRDRVTVCPDEAMGPGETEVRVTLASGGELTARADVDLPADDLARQWRSLAAKFRGLSGPVVGAAATERLVEAVAHLDGLADTATLLRLCVSAEGPAVQR